MTVELSILISIVSVAFAIFAGISNMKRSSRQETEKSTSTMVEVQTELKNITSSLNEFRVEMKSDMKSHREEFTRLNETVIKDRVSLENAWRVIEEVRVQLKQLQLGNDH